MNAPQNTNPQPTYRCPVCRATYNERAPFEQHVSTHPTDDHPYICFDCGASYSTKEILDYHTTHVCKQQQRAPISDSLDDNCDTLYRIEFERDCADMREFLQSMEMGRPHTLSENMPRERALQVAEIWETMQSAYVFYIGHQLQPRGIHISSYRRI